MNLSLRARLAKIEASVRQPPKPARAFTESERAVEVSKHLNAAAHKHGLLDLVALAVKDKIAEIILRAVKRRDNQAVED